MCVGTTTQGHSVERARSCTASRVRMDPPLERQPWPLRHLLTRLQGDRHAGRLFIQGGLPVRLQCVRRGKQIEAGTSRRWGERLSRGGRSFRCQEEDRVGRDGPPTKRGRLHRIRLWLRRQLLQNDHVAVASIDRVWAVANPGRIVEGMSVDPCEVPSPAAVQPSLVTCS